ncbi:MAG: hypothetical protein AB8B97_09550 [Granulosicoccus sp.]
MAHSIIEFQVDPASDAGQFLELLTLMTTGPDLQQLATHNGVTSSITQHPDGRVDAMLGYRVREEQGHEWQVTAHIRRMDESASVRVETTPLNTSSSLHHPQKPALVSVLLNSLGSHGIAPFKASASAFTVTQTYVPHMAGLMSGTGTNQPDCPVVYVSKSFLAGKMLDADELAQRLYGMAYLWVEDNKHVGQKLQKLLAKQNATFKISPCCLCLPDAPGIEHRVVFIDDIDASGEECAASIEKLVQQSITRDVPRNASSWITANEDIWGAHAAPEQDITAHNFETTSASNEKAPSKITDSAVKDMPTKQSVQNRQRDYVGGNSVVLLRGNVTDNVQNEALEMVLDAIDNYLKTKVASDEKADEPIRRADVLQAILTANVLPDRPLASRRKKIKSILTGERDIKGETESALQKIGIRVKHGGKHPKLILGDDTRYVLTASSSGSDVNGWRNVVKEINRRFF